MHRGRTVYDTKYRAVTDAYPDELSDHSTARLRPGLLLESPRRSNFPYQPTKTDD